MGLRDSILGALATAAVSALGDYLWANVLPHHLPVYWFAHAIVLFVTVGACLGWPTRKPLTGAIGAAVVGCVATIGFYFLQPVMGYSVMFVLFVALWVALGLFTGRVLQQHDSISAVLARSALAAAGSGLGPFHLLDERLFSRIRRAADSTFCRRSSPSLKREV